MGRRSKEQIMADIFDNATSQEQLDRLINAYNVCPAIGLALDNKNVVLARSLVEKLATNEIITAEDETLVLKYMVLRPHHITEGYVDESEV
jgi:predicted transcriptional regulator